MSDATPAPAVGAGCPAYRGGNSIRWPVGWGALPQPLNLKGAMRLDLCPDHWAPSNNLPSGAQRAREIQAIGSKHRSPSAREGSP